MTRSDARKRLAEQRVAAIRPTRPIRVRADWFGWEMTCTVHDEDMWCDRWIDAYTWACGHALVHHPKRGAA